MRALEFDFEVTLVGRATSLKEFAEFLGTEPHNITKTLVVRHGEGYFVLLIVPGDRKISWKKLRSHLGANRLSLADADEARQATGYPPGFITPFAATGSFPVIADATLTEPGRVVSIGAGEHGVDELLCGLDAEVADVTDPTG